MNECMHVYGLLPEINITYLLTYMFGDILTGTLMSKYTGLVPRAEYIAEVYHRLYKYFGKCETLPNFTFG